jgi:hypothetical protein
LATSASEGNIAVQAGSLIAGAPERFAPSMSAVGDPENPTGIGCDTSTTRRSIVTSSRPTVASRRRLIMRPTFGQSGTDKTTIFTTRQRMAFALAMTASTSPRHCGSPARSERHNNACPRDMYVRQ